jgi:hypothetical protein
MKWKGHGRRRSWPSIRYYPGVFLYGLRKATKNLSRDSRSPGQDLNRGPAEYEAGMLTTRQRCSVWQISIIWNCRAWKTRFSVGFEVLTAANMKTAAFRVVSQCSLVEVYRRFKDTCCLHYQGDRTRRYKPEDNHLKVPRGSHRSAVCMWLSKFSCAYDFITEQSKQQAEVIQNHANVNLRRSGRGEVRRRTYKRSKHGDGQAYDCH